MSRVTLALPQTPSDSVPGISFNPEVQLVQQTVTDGTATITPSRALKRVLGRGNNFITLFQSPNAYGAVNAGTQGPSTWTFKLSELGMDFCQRLYLQFLITVGGSSGTTFAINNYHSFLDHIELNLENSSTFHYPEELYYSALEQAVSPNEFSNLAQNIGITTVPSSGYYPPLYTIGNGQSGGVQLLAYLPLWNDEIVQADIPLAAVRSERTVRVFWSSNLADYGPAITSATALSDVKLYFTGIRLTERLSGLVVQRLKAIPFSAPVCYWRRYFTNAFPLASGSQALLTLLNSNGSVYALRIVLTSASTGVARFQPLNTVLNPNGYSNIQLYSQREGQYVFQTSPNLPSQYTQTLMAERQPFSPLQAFNTGLFDFANASNIVLCDKVGADGAPRLITPNDLILQITPYSGTPSSCTVYQLTLTQGTVTINKAGYMAVRYYEG